jgi:hypothetical protein
MKGFAQPEDQIIRAIFTAMKRARASVRLTGNRDFAPVALVFCRLPWSLKVHREISGLSTKAEKRGQFVVLTTAT